ncbi:MAG: hypothetical protein LQ340_006882 [Diploschistes diacapsis]|nr:MAG: hypothetical protein LQ340_006882 [Diploschistes diacapsis]
MSGASTTGIPASDLFPYTQGLGTFALMDGELILLDGTVYQLQSSGTVRTASASDQIPFAMATTLQPSHVFTASLHSKDVLHQELGRVFPGMNNLFVAYRVEAPRPTGWKRLKVRTVSGQKYPGQPLSELGESQKVLEYRDVRGTVVGFRSPANWQGIGVAGEHLHFISEDRGFGGHVLEMEVDGAEVQAALVADLHVQLPRTEEFNEAKLTVDDGGIRKVEG